MKELNIKNNFLAIEEEYSNYKDSQVVVLSAPFEATVSFGHGTKNGPKGILKSSHYVEFYDEEFDRELCFEKGICALAPMNFEKLSVKKSLDLIYKNVSQVLNDGKFPIVLGGEHSISAPIAKAFSEKYQNLSILQFDAHSDLRNEYSGTPHSHASVMARVAEFNRNIVQIGIRAQCIDEAKFIKENNINTFYMRFIRSGKYGDWMREALNKLNENVYITFDVDGFDPSFMANTGTPEPGGLFWDETIEFLKMVGKERNVVGFDVVELAPVKANPSPDFIAAKLTYKLLNCAFQNK
ncbi:MAG TPA: agmatinase [Ignavibacteriales bacterium]|nr:agmatinase [Ignavibacteriales bacterium]